MIKRILLTILAASLIWLSIPEAFAVIQLDNTLQPEGLTDLVIEEQQEGETGEVYATRQIIMFVGGFMSRVLLFAASVAILFLIAAGGQYIFAFGKDERIEKGKRGVTWSLIGLATVLLSYAIVQGIIQILVAFDAT